MNDERTVTIQDVFNHFFLNTKKCMNSLPFSEKQLITS